MQDNQHYITYISYQFYFLNELISPRRRLRTDTVTVVAVGVTMLTMVVCTVVVAS